MDNNMCIRKYKRSNPSGCANNIGEVCFGFFEEIELRKFMFCFGYKMKQSDYNSVLSEKESNYCIENWVNEVEKTYHGYTLNQKRNLLRYFRVCKSNITNKKNQNIYFSTATLSSVFALFIEKLVTELRPTDGLWDTILQIILVLVVTFFANLVILHVLFDPIWNKNIKIQMYEEYIAIIGDMILADNDHNRLDA